MTPKQQRFVDEYLIDLNATQAAIRAGYSEKTARQAGAENLSKPDIAEAIAVRTQERSERTKIDADHVLQRLHDIDTLDVADILDDDGHPLPLKSWPAAWRTSISGIDLETVLKLGPGGDVAATKTLVRKLKLPDKLRNLEMIGRHTQVKAWKDEEVETLGKGILELLADVRSERGVK